MKSKLVRLEYGDKARLHMWNLQKPELLERSPEHSLVSISPFYRHLIKAF